MAYEVYGSNCVGVGDGTIGEEEKGSREGGVVRRSTGGVRPEYMETPYKFKVFNMCL
jgi:hypothetical protein